ncbi:site-specific integrase [Oceanobacter mangrovi]|uniref:site-specific integrase n=1 Tax=Oceanobacter mangrovi TaxID=2862510 RepID=UPI001C8E9204|nr:tyrosine-type recombinase/integrase [Oceanobacter mangrovi]
MNWLFDNYSKSIQFARLSFQTKQGDEIRLRRIRLVFGAMLPSKVTSGHVRQYMDKIGETAPVSANRDHGFLSRVFSWAKERNIVKDNPVRDVKKFPESPRDRYVEDWEYDLVYRVALTTAYPWIAPMMEIAYLCRMRSQEIRHLATDRHLLPEGIFVERGKGSSNEITLWSERLEKAVKLAEELLGKAKQTENAPLFPARSGGFISKTAFSSAWRRVREKATTEGIMIDGVQTVLTHRFNFHDLKAKGVTDHETKASGHKTKKMQAIYDRKPAQTKATR